MRRDGYRGLTGQGTAYSTGCVVQSPMGSVAGRVALQTGFGQRVLALPNLPNLLKYLPMSAPEPRPLDTAIQPDAADRAQDLNGLTEPTGHGDRFTVMYDGA